MPCLPIANGVLCVGGPLYEYEGWFFEWHHYLGPMLLNRVTWEERVRIPDSFWQSMERFQRLTDEERAAYAVSKPTMGKRGQPQS
jgi:hypothetical protein